MSHQNRFQYEIHTESKNIVIKRFHDAFSQSFGLVSKPDLKAGHRQWSFQQN